MRSSVETLVSRVQKALTPDLLRARWVGFEHPLHGHCYVASEALWHALGGRQSGLSPMVGSDDFGTHWWLEGDGRRIDPTAAQYTDRGREPPYGNGRRIGFLTKKPSKRARVVLERIGF